MVAAPDIMGDQLERAAGRLDLDQGGRIRHRDLGEVIPQLVERLPVPTGDLGHQGGWRLGPVSLGARPSTRAAPFVTRPSSALYAFARASPAARAIPYPVPGPVVSRT